VVLAIPIQGAAQTFFEGEARGVAEVANGGGGVGLGVEHVARAARSVKCRDGDAFDLLQDFPDLVEGVAVCVAAVVDAAGDAGPKAAWMESAATSST